MHNDNPDDWRHVSVVPSSGLYRLSCWDKDSLPDEPVEIRFFDRKSEAKAHGALFIEGAL